MRPFKDGFLDDVNDDETEQTFLRNYGRLIIQYACAEFWGFSLSLFGNNNVNPSDVACRDYIEGIARADVLGFIYGIIPYITDDMNFLYDEALPVCEDQWENSKFVNASTSAVHEAWFDKSRKKII